MSLTILYDNTTTFLTTLSRKPFQSTLEVLHRFDPVAPEPNLFASHDFMDLLPLTTNHYAVGNQQTVADGAELVELIRRIRAQIGVLEDAFVKQDIRRY